MEISDDEPSVMGAGGGLPPRPSRWRYYRLNMAFYWKRLRVCLLCLWYLRHWPMSDLSTAEWRLQLLDMTASDAFFEGWGRCDDLGPPDGMP